MKPRSASRPVKLLPKNEPYCNDKSSRKNAVVECESDKRTFWTDEELGVLSRYYLLCPVSDFSLTDIAKTIGRTEASVALKGSRMGYSMPRGKRLRSDAARANFSTSQARAAQRPERKVQLSRQMIEWHANNEHPKGMLGKNHSAETRIAISKANTGMVRPISLTISAMKTKIAKHGSVSPNVKRGTWKADWRVIGGKKKFFRSKWEANYARYLQFQKEKGLIKDWVHESETFWFKGIKRGCVSYLPDFKVTKNDGTVEYHEVKGWMDSSSKTKIKRMKKYHPKIVLKIYGARWYKQNSVMLSGFIAGWE